MGIRWSYRLADKPNPDQRNREPVTTTGDASQNFSGSTGYSGTSTNPTTWVSQSGSSFTTVWGNSTEAGFTNGQLVTNSNLRAFTFAQLKSATHNFRRDMVVGKGGFGKVYKGWLKEKVQPKGIRKTLVAIKTLSSSSAQGVNEWLAEINFLGSLSHQNLVKLLGYCSEEGRFLLVYEFMPKGTLNRSLFGKRSVRPLSWDTRLKIAIGSAQGLYYLHSSVVIHRDLKSSNILLDESYNAKISDFGLAALGAPNHDMFVKGTLGYIDPHYASTGHLTVKSDVYSFGTVLVELLTGLRAVDKKRPVEQHYLVDWIKTHLTSRKKLKNIMDSKLEGKYSLKEAFQVAYLAFRCLQFNPQVRPSIKEVLETLEQIQASRGAKCSINGRNW